MNSENSNSLTGIFILFVAIIVNLIGDYIIFTHNNALVGSLLILLGILIAILCIFELVG
jgi:hypothetical protein